MLQKDITYINFNKCPNMYSVCRYYSRQHPKDYDIIGKHFYFFILRAPMKNVLKFLIKNICEYDVLFLG